MMSDAAGIKAALDEGRVEELIGLAETEWLDFKDQPYALHVADPEEQLQHAWELAKDVAAMANNPLGGCIVIGVRTKPDPLTSEDVADDIRQFPCGLLDAKQYADAIEAHSYPMVRGFSIKKYEQDGRCLALIVVPPQSEDDGPFLQKKVIDPDGKEVNGFTMPVRSGSHTRWQSIGMIHRDISEGRRSRRAGSVAIDDPAAIVQPARQLAPRLAKDVTEIEEYMGWSDSAIYALAAATGSRSGQATNIYSDDVKRNFANPPMLRYAGFGFGYSDRLMAGHGGLVAVDLDYRYRRLESDGYVVVALKADEDILGRTGGHPTGQPHRLRINVVALVEFTYEFCRFVTSALQPEIKSGWQLALLIRGARSRPWSLRLGLPWIANDWLRPDSYGYEPHSDEWSLVIDATEDSAANAAQLLASVCALFAQSQDDLAPFVQDGRVDEDYIKSLS